MQHRIKKSQPVGIRPGKEKINHFINLIIPDNHCYSKVRGD